MIGSHSGNKGSGSDWKRKSSFLAALVTLVALLAVVTGCGGGGTSSSSGSTAEGANGETADASEASPYKIYLSNAFVGNSFRVFMEKSAVAAAERPPLDKEVELTIANTENSVTAQISSLNQIIQQKPDAILVDAASDTALNPTIEKACAAGIVVVTFDEVATAPCAYKVSVDSELIGEAWANWFVKTLGGKGKIFQDLGLPGHGLSQEFNSHLEEALEENPELEVVCTFESQYAQGPEQEGVSKCLGAHPEVNGVWALGYAAGAMEALKSAGHAQVPVTGGGYNVGTTTCYQLHGTCLLASYPPSIGVLAMRSAVEVLDGKEIDKDQTTAFPFFQQGGAETTVPGEKVEPLKVGQNVFPELSGGLSLPWEIPGLEHVTIDEINSAGI
jgi:ribose transport system substrate-binding protein